MKSINVKLLFSLFFMLSSLIICCQGNASANAYPEVMFILDASGSMWGKTGGETKIDAARKVMSVIVPSLPPEVKTGLVLYGHRKKGDCSDIEMVIPSGSDRAGIISAVKNLNPKGMTPIADSIKMVAEILKGREAETTMILVSDGEETCNADPCGVVKALKQSGIKFILHVVGFGVDGKTDAQLRCLAQEGGGEYFSANDASSLLAALEVVKKEVVQKVEKAKTIKRKVVSRLGKLEIKIPEKGLRAVNTFKIVRKGDGKIIKTIKDPVADSTHPLLSGEYELIAGFANSNYKPDSEVSFGYITIKGGETVQVDFGLLFVNIADSLQKMPAGAVIITSENNKKFKLVTYYTGNSYYFYKPKPLPRGNYDFAVHYKYNSRYNTPDSPVILSKNIEILPGQQAVVTIDSGIVLKKVLSSPVKAWELVKTGSRDIVLRIEQASNGDFPLWEPYAVSPGVYDLYVYMEGMDEPLPAGEGINIAKGELLEFDSGL